MFRGSLRDFLAGGTSSREKHLDKFYQFLSQGYWRLVCEGFCNSLASQAPNHIKDLENFQKSGFFGLLRLNLVTDSRVEAPVTRFTQNAWRLPS